MAALKISIRPETPSDRAAIYQVNQLAYAGKEAEPRSDYSAPTPVKICNHLLT